MNLFCQKDPRWADLPIGASKLTIGSYGCTLSDVAMLSSAWNVDNGLTPAQVAANTGWFTKPGNPSPADPHGEGGLILWGNISIHGLKYEGRLHVFDKASVISATINPNRAALIEVRLPGGSKHWVVAVRWVPIAGWRIADPLTGTYRWLPAGWMPIGCAFFSHA